MATTTHCLLDGANTATNREGNIQRARHALHPLAYRLPPFDRCGDVKEDQLIRALITITHG
jgi:hypothetical protein